MLVDDVRKFEGLKIKILLKNRDFQLNGYIKEIKGDTIFFKDKFNNIVPVSSESIAAVIPLNNNGGRNGRD